jgi:hypothetical protein
VTDLQLIGAVRQMRHHQREYFKSRNDWHLISAQELEQLVDRELERRRKPQGRTLVDIINDWDEKPTERQVGAE